MGKQESTKIVQVPITWVPGNGKSGPAKTQSAPEFTLGKQ
jgi:hypothetical protein